MKAKYCKCKNTYTINNCDERLCNAQYYWAHGIGSLTGQSIELVSSIFDNTFDETFN